MSDFLVNTNTGKYYFREDLVKEYGRRKLFSMLSEGLYMDEDQWLKKKEKKKSKANAPVLELTNNPCKYCNKTPGNGEPIFGHVDEGNVVAISNNEYEGWCLEIWAHFGCEEYHKINYCPFCGRKLTEDK